MTNQLWNSFRGCFVGVGHYVISLLAGVATWHFMKSQTFPAFVVWSTALIIGMLVFQAIYILQKRIGE